MLDSYYNLDLKFLFCCNKYKELNKNIKPGVKLFLFPLYLMYILYYLIHFILENILIIFIEISKFTAKILDDEIFNIVGYTSGITPLVIPIALIGFIILLLFVSLVILLLFFILVVMVSRFLLFIISYPMVVLNKPEEI